MREVLQDLGDVTVRAAHAVRQGGTERLGGEQVGALEVLAGAGVADDEIGDDVSVFDESFRDAGL